MKVDEMKFVCTLCNIGNMFFEHIENSHYLHPSSFNFNKNITVCTAQKITQNYLK